METHFAHSGAGGATGEGGGGEERSYVGEADQISVKGNTYEKGKFIKEVLYSGMCDHTPLYKLTAMHGFPATIYSRIQQMEKRFKILDVPACCLVGLGGPINRLT